MATTKATDRRRGRGLFLAALAALGLIGATAGAVAAQDFRGYGYGGGYEAAAYQGRGWRGGREPGGPGGYAGRYGFGGGGGYRGYPGQGPRDYGGGRGGFQRGQVLPPEQRDRYVDDPGRYHLRAPPNGYGWVGDGRNAYLMQRSTGMVLDSVPGAYEPGPRYGGGREGGRGRGRR